MLGFDGADYIADKVYTTAKLGMEQHLIDMFGDAGLEKSPAAQQPMVPVTAVPQPDGITWAADAEKLLGKVPFFVRGRVRKNTEKFAEEQGHHTITADILQAAREALGG